MSGKQFLLIGAVLCAQGISVVALTGSASAVCNGKAEHWSGSPYADTIVGDETSRVYNGNGGDDIISAHDGDDTLCGGDGSDWVGADASWNGLTTSYGVWYGDDWALGGGGCDRVMGGNWADIVGGGEGNDTTPVWTGCNPQYSAAGGDGGMVDGGNGDDHVNGGDGNDGLWGSAGNDVGNPGAGFDHCSSSLESIPGGCEVIF